MARVTHNQTSFTAGELSPRLYGRTDLAKYQNGLATCRNMTLMPHGGVARRSGSIFVSEVKNSSTKVRLVAFEFSTLQTYVLEFGHLYIRVFKDGGQVVSGGTAYEIVTPYTESELTGLSWAQDADTLFLVHPGHKPRTLTRTDHTAWTLSEMVFVDGPYLDENTETTKTITPSGTGQYIKNGTFDNSIEYWTDKSSGTNAKILFDDGNYLDLIGVTSGTAYAEQTVTVPMANVEYTLEFEIKSGPIVLRVGTSSGGGQIVADTSYDKGTQTVKITPTATTIYVGFLHTANASRAIDSVSLSREESITLSANFDVFESGHVGAFWRIKQGAYSGYVQVTVVTDARTATAIVKDPLASTSATSFWREGAWSDYQGWPSVVVFHQQRLVFGNAAKSPQTIWASKVGKYTDFTPTVNDDDPINLTMASNQVNAVAYLVSSKSLVVGTIGSEWRIGAADSDTALSPDSAVAKEETRYGGASGLRAVKAGSSVVFVQRGKRKVRELAYNYYSNSWLAPDLSLLAEHITSSGIVDIAYAQDPDSIVWFVRADGVLIGLTYNRAEQVVGWHRHDTDGKFEAVETITVGEIDQVWTVVKRTINGVTRRYIEYFADPFVDQDTKDACFLDCSLAYDGTPATTFTGLGHLEGKSVDILADGALQTSKVVTSGAVTIANAASKVCVGLPYTSEIITLGPEAGGDDGTAQGKIKRVSRCVLRVHRSLGYEIGTSESNYQRPSHRTTATKLGQAPELFTGDDPVFLGGEYEREGQVYVRQTQPYPLTILSMAKLITVNS